MRKKPNRTADVQRAPLAERVTPQRNRLEIIRFPTEEDDCKAMGIFHKVNSPEIFFTFRETLPPRTCVTNTATVRALREHGFVFERLTENAYRG
jgi:hypothetical protein